MVFVLVWTSHTKTGSGITMRPSDGLGSGGENAAPGAEGKSSIAGKVYGEQDRCDEGPALRDPMGAARCVTRSFL